MLFFNKPEFRELNLPFIYDDNQEDLFAGAVSIEAYGNILGENKYCYASYQVKPEYIDEIVSLLKDTADKTVKVVIKIKKGKVKDFKIDVHSLAEAYNDERFESLELLCWGFNNKSFKDFNDMV